MIVDIKGIYHETGPTYPLIILGVVVFLTTVFYLEDNNIHIMGIDLARRVDYKAYITGILILCVCIFVFLSLGDKINIGHMTSSWLV